MKPLALIIVGSCTLFFVSTILAENEANGNDDDINNNNQNNKRPSCPYEVLGIEKTATMKEIRAAYMTLAKQHHPDKGGDEIIFREVAAAYALLSDPEKKEQYDRFGMAEDFGGAQPGQGPSWGHEMHQFDPFELFRQFSQSFTVEFGGGHGGGATFSFGGGGDGFFQFEPHSEDNWEGEEGQQESHGGFFPDFFFGGGDDEYHHHQQHHHQMHHNAHHGYDMMEQGEDDGFFFPSQMFGGGGGGGGGFSQSCVTQTVCENGGCTTSTVCTSG